jgi:Protein of unknown function (DUF2510)
VRREDAPRPGWYPDPESRTALRWWDGLDWTDARRAPPSDAELRSFEGQAEFEASHRYIPPAHDALPAASAAASRVGRPESQQVIDDVRRAARGEVDRAAEIFARQARAMQTNVGPLISEYTNRVVKWIRIAVIVAIALLVAYFVFQVIAQASLFEWIGDRIDNFTDKQGAAVTTVNALTGGS